jgi:triosephosphate isomerase (TIM)
MKSFIIAGNWKMNKTPKETLEFIKAFKEQFQHKEGRYVVFFPSYLSVSIFQQEFEGSNVNYGGQNCHFESTGAFTGEVSAEMLRSLGATHCLVGHSERRTLFGETSLQTAKKVKAIEKMDMIPVLCVGETEQERASGNTLEVVKEQLEIGLSEHLRNNPVILAYEPVWAIGTGKVATSEDVKSVHQFIREWTQTKFSQRMPILYGGSVSAKNSKELESVDNVDGFLIGGASLKPESFLAIYG